MEEEYAMKSICISASVPLTLTIICHGLRKRTDSRE